MTPLLAIEALTLRVGAADILRSIDLQVASGEIVALVGESGSGKSLTGLSILRLTPPGSALGGAVRLNGVDLLTLNERAMCARRGSDVGVVFQEPMTALNPLMTIGAQVAEAARRDGASAIAAAAMAGDALARVGLGASNLPHNRYPHELSGGQRQRVAIAIATVRKPKLLIADEPTTALDVTTQAQILTLLAGLAREDGAGLIFITHDLAVAATIADRIVVMQQGRVVEAGAAEQILRAPNDPYTNKLLAAAAYAPRRSAASRGDCALRADGAVVAYKSFTAVKGATLAVHAGETVAVVGESGSGKSSLARAMLGLQPLSGGAVRIGPFDPAQLRGRAAHPMRALVQAVFQDPYGSFDPRWRVGRIIAEPLGLLRPVPDGDQAKARIAALLQQVGLAAADADKFPHQFSGGQRQRIAIARALATEPQALVLDEPLSALDVSIRAQVLELLSDLAERLRLAVLFITHDLALARGFAHRIVVMKAGEIVEAGETEAIFAAPQHPYTQALLAATPTIAQALAEKQTR
jgi:peptide/nickel transport system ATP-binding protein